MNGIAGMDGLMTQLSALLKQACAIWMSGGWCMVAIGIIAVVMFGLGMHVHLRLQGKKFRSVRESTWRHWIEHPEQRRGPIGRLLDFATAGKSLKSTSSLFEELRATEIAPFERDLNVMKICVGAAPLLGLFGTVTGMLTTFSALASGSGGEKTMGLIAEGISEALVTTETGLVIALPGLFIQHILTRKHERYTAFLARLETACNQTLFRRLRAEKQQDTAQQALTYVPVSAPCQTDTDHEEIAVSQLSASNTFSSQSVDVETKSEAQGEYVSEKVTTGS